MANMATFEIRGEDGAVKRTVTLDHLYQTTGPHSKRSLWASAAAVGEEARFMGQQLGLYFTLRRIS